MTKTSAEKFCNRYMGVGFGKDHANTFLELSKNIGKDNDGYYQHDMFQALTAAVITKDPT